MNKFKICPECGTKNPPDVSDCVNCDCDLMSVPVTDAQQVTVKNSSEDKLAVKSSLIRVCSECGEKNLPNARKCANCGEDISDVIPTSKAESKSAAFVLRSLDGRIVFKIDCDNITVGREHELKDYLAAKTFVSRRHCRLTLENNELFVEDLNSANGTYVNNRKIFQKTKLAKSDEIGLGGAVFNGSRQDNATYFLVG
ncbi:MAG: FHA domain-containing protein [Selenomonadaceae bacterium]|nr:FHA domain-containing protein [Selenomonadaceae bacterium]